MNALSTVPGTDELRAHVQGRNLLSTTVLLLAVGLASSPKATAADDPFGPSWPEGEGRALTGAWCGGCHSLNLVTQQGLTRKGWDELLLWMTEKQNMPPLQGDNRDTVLDYLAANFDTGRVLETGSDSDALPAPDFVQGLRLPLLDIRPPE